MLITKQTYLEREIVSVRHVRQARSVQNVCCRAARRRSVDRVPRQGHFSILEGLG